MGRGALQPDRPSWSSREANSPNSPQGPVFRWACASSFPDEEKFHFLGPFPDLAFLARSQLLTFLFSRDLGSETLLLLLSVRGGRGRGVEAPGIVMKLPDQMPLI